MLWKYTWGFNTDIAHSWLVVEMFFKYIKKWLTIAAEVCAILERISDF